MALNFDEVLISFRNKDIRQPALLLLLKDEIQEFVNTGISAPLQVKKLNEKYKIKLSAQSYRRWINKHIKNPSGIQKETSKSATSAKEANIDEKINEPLHKDISNFLDVSDLSSSGQLEEELPQQPTIPSLSLGELFNESSSNPDIDPLDLLDIEDEGANYNSSVICPIDESASSPIICDSDIEAFSEENLWLADTPISTLENNEYSSICDDIKVDLEENDISVSDLDSLDVKYESSEEEDMDLFSLIDDDIRGYFSKKESFPVDKEVIGDILFEKIIKRASRVALDELKETVVPEISKSLSFTLSAFSESIKRSSDYFGFNTGRDLLINNFLGSADSTLMDSPSMAEAVASFQKEVPSALLKYKDMLMTYFSEVEESNLPEILLDDKFTELFKTKMDTEFSEKLNILSKKYVQYEEEARRKDKTIDLLTNIIERMDKRLDTLERKSHYFEDNTFGPATDFPSNADNNENEFTFWDTTKSGSESQIEDPFFQEENKEEFLMEGNNENIKPTDDFSTSFPSYPLIDTEDTSLEILPIEKKNISLKKTKKKSKFPKTMRVKKSVSPHSISESRSLTISSPPLSQIKDSKKRGFIRRIFEKLSS